MVYKIIKCIKEKDYKEVNDKILVLLLTGVIVVSLYSILTYGRIVLSSDSATSCILAQAVWEHNSLFPKTWNYAQGEVWTYTTVVSFAQLILYPVFHGSDFSRVLGSAVCLVVTFIALRLFFRNGLRNNGHLIAFPLTTIFYLESIFIFCMMRVMGVTQCGMHLLYC